MRPVLQSDQSPDASSLTRLCLGQDEERHGRHLAWAASVCVLFLVIGAAGFWQSQNPRRALPRPEQLVPVVFMATEITAAPKPEPVPVSPSAVAEPSTSDLRVTPVVAVYSPEIPFPVPVTVAAIMAPARFAEPPPAQPASPATTTITQFKPGADMASTPQPEYPPVALRRGYQGKVVINFTVAASGEVAKAEVGRGSGFAVLDDAALNVVKNRWRFAPGGVRHHFVEISFQLK